ncbi:MAG: hypothetical protein AB8B68_02400 [Rickettsiaceae bacterium]
MSEEIREYLEPGKKNIILIYILFLGSLVFPILCLVGGAFAYANKSHGNKLLRTHYLFAFKTFFIFIIGFMLSVTISLIFLAPILYVIVLVWSVMRGVFALQFLFHNSPHPNPLTLWIK